MPAQPAPLDLMDVLFVALVTLQLTHQRAAFARNFVYYLGRWTTTRVLLSRAPEKKENKEMKNVGACRKGHRASEKRRLKRRPELDINGRDGRGALPPPYFVLNACRHGTHLNRSPRTSVRYAGCKTPTRVQQKTKLTVSFWLLLSLLSQPSPPTTPCSLAPKPLKAAPRARARHRKHGRDHKQGRIRQTERDGAGDHGQFLHKKLRMTSQESCVDETLTDCRRARS